MTALRSRLLSWPVLVGVVLAVGAFLAFGLPALRGEELTAADKAFVKTCKDHGGTPELAPGSGDYVKDARSCEVRYRDHSYEMYAVTANGFDEREAASAKRACDRRAALAREEGQAARYVWHPLSAICEEQR
jgi:hypothetical protein